MIFILKAKNIHGDEYSYEYVPYEFKMTDKIPIKCKKRGVFNQIARNHINSRNKCPLCSKEQRNKKLMTSFEEFIKKAEIIHNKMYKYYEESYKGAGKKIKIQCKKCGHVFEQTGTMHLNGNGCPICHPMPKSFTHDEFVTKLKLSHPNLEVLSIYNGDKKNICVKCTIHNYTFNTTPNRLKQGSNCIMCYNERRGKSRVKNVTQLLQEFKDKHNNKYLYPYISDEYMKIYYLIINF